MRIVPSDQCEVLVVGWGIAGSVAAITAHDESSDVIIVEKMPNGGGSTAVSGGTICTPTSMEFADYLYTTSFGTTEREVIDTFVKVALRNADFIRKLGGGVVPGAAIPRTRSYPTPVLGPSFPTVPKAEHMVKLRLTPDSGGGEKRDGPRLWSLLKKNIETRKIKVMTSTRATELVKNERGEVIGIIAERERESIFIKAKKAVILATGGYDNDKATLWEYYTPKPVKFLGSPHSTGDGIRMLQKTGAALWHMTNMVSTTGFQAPGYEAAFLLYCFDKDFIYVNKYGKRFTREAGEECHRYATAVSHFDTNRIEFPAIPAYIIFGERTRRAGALCPSNMGFNMDFYEWSSDNSAEIAKGWIVDAKSIVELARKLFIDETTLQRTVDRFNAACMSGKDEEFGRPGEDMMVIEGPPYYAIEIYPCLFLTQGGGRRDKEARVLNPDGKPIPRLYEAGDLGGICGWLYQGSSGLTDGIVFGQIAGRNAAAERTLDNEA